MCVKYPRAGKLHADDDDSDIACICIKSIYHAVAISCFSPKYVPNSDHVLFIFAFDIPLIP